MPNGLIELKPYPWITRNAFYLSADRSIIIKHHLPKKRRFSFYKYRALRLIGYPIPYELRSETARCAHEREIYAHWCANGYRVPRLIDDPSIILPGPNDRCIILEYIDGEDLHVLLTDRNVDSARRLGLIESLFAESNRRHAQVFAKQDRKLIKYDANLRNIVVLGDALFHIDFECGRIAETLQRGAAREISRYAVDAVKAMGHEFDHAIVNLLKREYSHTDVLRRVIASGAAKKPDPRDEFAALDLARLLQN